MKKFSFILALLVFLSTFAMMPNSVAAEDLNNDYDVVNLGGDPVFTAQARFLGGRWLEGAYIIVENRIGPDYADIIRSRTNSWNAPSNGHYYMTSVNPTTRGCEFVINRIVVCVANVPGSAIGSATNYTQNGAIVGSIVRIETPNYLLNQGWAHGVVVHELGHTLGLGHVGQPESETCMRPVVGRKLPGPYDYQSITLLYGP